MYTPKAEPRVERWRSYVIRYLPHIPPDFILAWIDKESDGRADIAPTSLDERGLMQIHPSEAQGMGLSSSEWSYLKTKESDASFSMDKHFEIMARFVKYKEKGAKQTLSQLGVNWSGGDLWTFVKLMHGLPIIATQGIPAYKNAHGGSPPPTFSAFAQWALTSGLEVTSGGKSWDAARVKTIINNALDAGKYAYGGLSIITLLALGGFVVWYFDLI